MCVYVLYIYIYIVIIIVDVIVIDILLLLLLISIVIVIMIMARLPSLAVGAPILQAEAKTRADDRIAQTGPRGGKHFECAGFERTF